MQVQGRGGIKVQVCPFLISALDEGSNNLIIKLYNKVLSIYHVSLKTSCSEVENLTELI
jgi:hypothetical protein